MRLNNSQRFAIDWKRTNEQGDFYVGDRTMNESYLDYGTPVFAVADGTVTSTEDDMDANVPGILPASDPVLAAKLTVENIDGNHIIMDIGDGVYLSLIHICQVAVSGASQLHLSLPTSGAFLNARLSGPDLAERINNCLLYTSRCV